MSSSEKEKSIINYSFLNIESGIVNRLHKDLILSVIAAARFQIQTEKLKQYKNGKIYWTKNKNCP